MHTPASTGLNEKKNDELSNYKEAQHIFLHLLPGMPCLPPPPPCPYARSATPDESIDVPPLCHQLEGFSGEVAAHIFEAAEAFEGPDQIACTSTSTGSRVRLCEKGGCRQRVESARQLVLATADVADGERLTHTHTHGRQLDRYVDASNIHTAV